MRACGIQLSEAITSDCLVPTNGRARRRSARRIGCPRAGGKIGITFTSRFPDSEQTKLSRSTWKPKRLGVN